MLRVLPECGYDILFRGLDQPMKNVTLESTAKQFTSTSDSVTPAVDYMTKDVNTLIIYLGFGKHAKDISRHSLYPGETECLISPLQPIRFCKTKSIDLSGVDVDEYKKLDGICFVTDPVYFSWNRNNSNAHENFKTAVLEGAFFTKAVKSFESSVKMEEPKRNPPKAAFGRTFQEMSRCGDVKARLEHMDRMYRLMKSKTPTSYSQSDTSSITSDAPSEASDLSISD